MTSLTRVLEPEVMDSIEEARDYDAMDHSAVNRVFVADFLAVWNGTGPILDLGTGTAQIPIELCRQDSRSVVTAVDAAAHMLALAKQNVDAAGLHEHIRLERADAKQLPFADDGFAAVMSNSIVHHIPEPIRVLAEMVRVLAPGGLLFVRDLLRPADEPTLHGLVDMYAAGANEHARQMFADSLHAALSLEEMSGLVAGLGNGVLQDGRVQEDPRLNEPLTIASGQGSDRPDGFCERRNQRAFAPLGPCRSVSGGKGRGRQSQSAVRVETDCPAPGGGRGETRIMILCNSRPPENRHVF